MEDLLLPEEEFPKIEFGSLILTGFPADSAERLLDWGKQIAQAQLTWAQRHRAEGDREKIEDILIKVATEPLATKPNGIQDELDQILALIAPPRLDRTGELRETFFEDGRKILTDFHQGEITRDEALEQILALLPSHRLNRPELREKLAELEHEQWMEWAKTLMVKEQLSPERIERWQSLFVPYSELTEEQKDQDREWADKVLALMPSEEEIRAEVNKEWEESGRKWIEAITNVKKQVAEEIETWGEEHCEGHGWYASIKRRQCVVCWQSLKDKFSESEKYAEKPND